MAFNWNEASKFFNGFRPSVQNFAHTYQTRQDKKQELKDAMALLGFKAKLDQDANQMEQRRETFGMNAPTNDEMGAMQNFPYGQSVNVPGTNLGPIASQIIGDVGLPVPPAPSIVRGMPDNYVNANSGTVSTKAQAALADPSAMLSMKTGVPRKQINLMNMQNDLITGRQNSALEAKKQAIQDKISMKSDVLKKAGFSDQEASLRASLDELGLNDSIKLADETKKNTTRRDELMILAMKSVPLPMPIEKMTAQDKAAFENSPEVQKKFYELLYNKTPEDMMKATMARILQNVNF